MLNKRLQLAIRVCLAGHLIAGSVWASDARLSDGNQRITLHNAVQLTLENSPDIQSSDFGVKMAKASARMASGAYNLNTSVSLSTSTDRSKIGDLAGLKPEDREKAELMGIMDSTSKSSSNSLSFSFDKPFRNGISSSLSISTDQGDTNAHPQGLGIRPNNTSVSFSVTVPLLKGSGRTAATDEISAKLEHQATLADFHHTIAATLVETIKAFGNYSSAYWYVEQVQKSQQRVQSLIERAGSASEHLQGYLSDKKGKIIDAQQTLDEAKIALAGTMGISSEDLEALGAPDTSFPDDWKNNLQHFNPKALVKIWEEEAQTKRMDLKAARLRLEAAKLKLEQARKDVLPQLDLNLSTGYKGFSQYNGVDKVAESYYKNVNGMDYSVGMTLSYPFGNDVAKGNLEVNQMSYHQSKVDTDDKVRTALLGVKNEVSNLQGRMKKAVQITETVAAHGKALESLYNQQETTKNTGSLISTMELEDKYLESLKEASVALTDLATAIASARLATGTLTVTNEASGETEVADLTVIPNQ